MKHNIVWRVLKRFLSDKKAVAVAIFMSFLGSLVGVATPIFNKLLTEKIIPDKDISLFVWITIIVLVLNVVNLLASFFTNRLFINKGVNITEQIRQEMVYKQLYADKEKMDVGDFLICSNTFLEETNTFFISYVYIIFDSTLKILFYLPFFAIYGSWLALIMLAAVLLAFTILSFESKLAKVRSIKNRHLDSQRYTFMIKMYEEMQKPDFEESKDMNFKLYQQKVFACDKAWMRYIFAANPFPYVFNFIWYVGFAICAILAFNLGTLGSVTLASFIAFCILIISSA